MGCVIEFPEAETFPMAMLIHRPERSPSASAERGSPNQSGGEARWGATDPGAAGPAAGSTSTESAPSCPGSPTTTNAAAAAPRRAAAAPATTHRRGLDRLAGQLRLPPEEA